MAILEDPAKLQAGLQKAREAIIELAKGRPQEAGPLIVTVAREQDLDEGVVQKALWQLINAREVILTEDFHIKA